MPQESIPTIPCVNSKHPVPTRSLRFFQRAAACSTGSALWLHHGQASVVTAGKACLMQRSRVWSQSCGLQDLLQCSDVLSELCYVTAANQRTLVEIELLATVSWKWGCRPFSADVRKMCRTAEKRFVPHVRLWNPFPRGSS